MFYPTLSRLLFGHSLQYWASFCAPTSAGTWGKDKVCGLRNHSLTTVNWPCHNGWCSTSSLNVYWALPWVRLCAQGGHAKGSSWSSHCTTGQTSKCPYNRWPHQMALSLAIWKMTDISLPRYGTSHSIEAEWTERMKWPNPCGITLLSQFIRNNTSASDHVFITRVTQHHKCHGKFHHWKINLEH